MTTPTSRIEIQEETSALRIPDEEANTIQQSTGKEEVPSQFLLKV